MKVISDIKCCKPTILLNPYIKKFYYNSTHLVGPNYVQPLHINSFFIPWSKLSKYNLGANEDNWNQFYLSEFDGTLHPLYIRVPCGKCELCREKQSSEWSFRAICESRYSTSTPLFLTLTYAPEYLPANGVNKEDVQLFLKRLRSYFDYRQVAHNLRYLCCAEYGVDPRYSRRPHYHMIIWNFPTLESWKLVVDTIELNWQKGHARVLPVTKGGINYVMKYMRKEQEVPVGKNPAFFLCSRRNGSLGAQFARDNFEYFTSNPDVTKVSATDPYTGTSMTMSIPAYFKRLWFPTDSRLVEKELRDAYSECWYHHLQLKAICGDYRKWIDNSIYAENIRTLCEDWVCVKNKFSFLGINPEHSMLSPTDIALFKPDKNHKYFEWLYTVERICQQFYASLSVIKVAELEYAVIMKCIKRLEIRRKKLDKMPKKEYNLRYELDTLHSKKLEAKRKLRL